MGDIGSNTNGGGILEEEEEKEDLRSKKIRPRSLFAGLEGSAEEPPKAGPDRLNRARPLDGESF